MSEITAESRPSGLKIGLGLLVIYLVWGSTFLAIRIGVEALPPLLMSGFRWTLAGSVLLAFAWLRGATAASPKEWLRAAGLAVLLIAASNGGVTWAESRVESGPAALFVATVSLWMVLFDWLRPGGTRPTARVAVGLAFGLSGVLFLSGFLSRGVAHVDPAGAAVLILSSAAFAAGSLLSRKPSASPLRDASMQMLTGGATLLVTGLLAGERLTGVSARGASAVLYLVVFGSLVGFNVYAWLLRVAPPAVVSTYACVNPVVAVLLGWAFAGETLNARTLVATGLIVLAVALIVSSRVNRPPASVEPESEVRKMPALVENDCHS